MDEYPTDIKLKAAQLSNLRLSEKVHSLELSAQSDERYILKLQDDRAHYFDKFSRLRRALEFLSESYNMPDTAREFIARTLEENPVAREA